MFRFSLLALLLACAVTHVAYSSSSDISWDLSASYREKGKSKKILDHVQGTASSGSLHAIMGPSGSGKSTVISILSNTVPKGSLKIIGYVAKALALEEVEPIFVAQEDLLFPQLTAEETLQTALALKSTSLRDLRQNENVPAQILNQLGLKKVAKSKVGDAKTRGLSGGEKKRLCIGNEIIGSYDTGRGGGDSSTRRSRLIFADEPTSGLDSFQANNVMQLLRELADQGNTVICAIHQPRASIYRMFDDVTLLSEGKTVYSGPRESLVSYFSGIGHPLPEEISPADHYIDLVSVDYSSPEGETDSRHILEELQDEFSKSEQCLRLAQNLKTLKAATSTSTSSVQDKLYMVAASIDIEAIEAESEADENVKYRPAHRRGLGLGGFRDRLCLHAKKTQILLVRAWRTVVRDKSLNIARFMSSSFSALLFGAIYFQLGTGAGTVPDRLGLLQVAAVNTAMTSLIKATTSFVQEKLIVNRERRVGSYSVLPYFVSKLVAEAPLSAFFPCFAGTIMYSLCGLNRSQGRLGRFLAILTIESFASSSLGMLVGSYASTVDSAIATAPAVMVVFIVFGGLYVVNTPKWLSWVPKCSLIRWAYEALAINEFDGLELVPEANIGPKSVNNGNQVLENMGMGGSSVKKALLAQLGIIGFNYVATYVSLLRQKPRFEKITAPASEDKNDKNDKNEENDKNDKNEEIVVKKDKEEADEGISISTKGAHKAVPMPMKAPPRV